MAVIYRGARVWEGLTTDTKPTNTPNGSLFIERDSDKIFVFDTGAWNVSTGAPADAEYLVGLADGDLTNEFVVAKTKGNILTASGSVLVNKAVGANGKVPKADSAQTDGWLWDDALDESAEQQGSLPADSADITTTNTWSGHTDTLPTTATLFKIVKLEAQIGTVGGGLAVIGVFSVDANPPTDTGPQLVAGSKEFVPSANTLHSFSGSQVWSDILRGGLNIYTAVNTDTARRRAATSPTENSRFTETYATSPGRNRTITWLSAQVGRTRVTWREYK